MIQGATMRVAELIPPYRVLAVCSIAEASTGVVLLIHPSLVTTLLLGAGLTATGTALGRVAGIALISLGLACWPVRDAADGNRAARRGMLTYNALLAFFLGYVGVEAEKSGILLWPAVAAHAVLALLLAPRARGGNMTEGVKA